jgi:glycosyltransferase involved in cell wall biosynthesis
VIAHDVRLAGLYAWTAHNRPDLEPRGLRGALLEMYGAVLPPEASASGWPDVADYERYGLLMAREAIASAERYLVHSRYAADLARLDAEPGDERKIGVLPFGVGTPAEPAEPRSNGKPLVSSLGIVGPAKQPEKLIEAFARVLVDLPEAELVFAGPLEEVQRRPLHDLAEKLGIGRSVRFTGELADDEFARALRGSSVAVQLRAVSNGETSAAVLECLAVGVPTIVTALGPARELPDDVVVKVGRDVGPSELGTEVKSLLRNPGRQAALRQAGLRYVRERSFAHAAEALWREIERSA